MTDQRLAYDDRLPLLLRKHLLPAVQAQEQMANRRGYLSAIQQKASGWNRAYQDLVLQSMRNAIRRAGRTFPEDWMLIASTQWIRSAVEFGYVGSWTPLGVAVLPPQALAAFAERCGRQFPSRYVEDALSILSGTSLQSQNEGVVDDGPLGPRFETMLLVAGARYMNHPLRLFLSAVASARELSEPKPNLVAVALGDWPVDPGSATYAGALAYLRTAFVLDAAVSDAERLGLGDRGRALRAAWLDHERCLLGWSPSCVERAYQICSDAFNAMSRADLPWFRGFDLFGIERFTPDRFFSPLLELQAVPGR